MQLVRSHKSILVSLVVALMAILGSVAGAVVAKGYQTSDTSLQPGMAASLTEDTITTPASIEAATTTTSSRFVGIVTTLEEALLTTNDKGSNVYVTTSGEITAYVSDLNGVVKKGDYLSLSPLKGVLMKSEVGDVSALATALNDSNVDNATTIRVNNSSDGQTDVKLNKILIDLAPKAVENQEKKDSFLVLVGSSITGKEVNALQVILAFVIFFILLIVEGSIIYGAIYSSIISLGRNPLSKAAVYKELAQVIGIALFVLGLGLGAIYMVLWA